MQVTVAVKSPPPKMTLALNFYAISHIRVVFSAAVNTAADFVKWPRFVPARSHPPTINPFPFYHITIWVQVILQARTLQH